MMIQKNILLKQPELTKMIRQFNFESINSSSLITHAISESRLPHKLLSLILADPHITYLSSTIISFE